MLFSNRKNKDRERQDILWNKYHQLVNLGRPATAKELEEFKIVCEQLAVPLEEAQARSQEIHSRPLQTKTAL